MTFAQNTQYLSVYLYNSCVFSKKTVDNNVKFGIIIIVPVYNVILVYCNGIVRRVNGTEKQKFEKAGKRL